MPASRGSPATRGESGDSGGSTGSTALSGTRTGWVALAASARLIGSGIEGAGMSSAGPASSWSSAEPAAAVAVPTPPSGSVSAGWTGSSGGTATSSVAVVPGRPPDAATPPGPPRVRRPRPCSGSGCSSVLTGSNRSHTAPSGGMVTAAEAT